MYKCLPVEEKQRWEAYAAQDKARFEAEMAAYHPPYGYDKTGAMVEELRVKTYTRRGVNSTQGIVNRYPFFESGILPPL